MKFAIPIIFVLTRIHVIGSEFSYPYEYSFVNKHCFSARIGEVISLNCSSKPSKPAEILKWYVNDEKVPEKLLHRYPVIIHEDELETSVLGLEFTVTAEHFQKDTDGQGNLTGNIMIFCMSFVDEKFNSVTTLPISRDIISPSEVELIKKLKYSDNPIIHREGSTVFFDCDSDLQFHKCELFKIDQQQNFNFVTAECGTGENRTCILELRNVSKDDAGDYFCFRECSKPPFPFCLFVAGFPDKVELTYEGKPLSPDAITVVSLDQHGIASIECNVHGGNPYMNIKWFVNHQPHVEFKRERKVQDSGASHYRSYVKVRFDYKEEKKVECVVKEPGAVKIVVVGTFGRKYRTDSVELRDATDANDRFVLKNEVKEVVCEANGLPLPQDFLIKKQTEAGDWEIVASGASYNVTETGTYACEARNTDDGGNLMKNYVSSKKLQIFNIVEKFTEMEKKLTEIIDRQEKMFEILENLQNARKNL